MRMVPFYFAIAGSLMAVSYLGYVDYGRYVRPPSIRGCRAGC